MKGWRVVLVVVGFAVILIGIALWLVPTSSTTSTVTERSTTTAAGNSARNGTTTVQRTTRTTAPGATRSDAVMVALVTLGGALLIVAVMWDRIQGFAFAGVSVQLADAGFLVEKIEIVEAAAIGGDWPYSTRAEDIGKKVRVIAEQRRGFVLVSLVSGGFWRPSKLCMFMVLLAHRSRVEVIVFIGDGASGEQTYLGAADLETLAEKLEKGNEALATAREKTDGMPMRSEKEALELGTAFFGVLETENSEWALSNDRVDKAGLALLAGPLLTTDCVESDDRKTLSSQQQRASLVFPLVYVPITDCGRLVSVADKQRLATRIARAATAPR